jgi:hypothetical protein
MIHQAGEPGILEYSLPGGSPSSDDVTRSLEEYRLPNGAILMEKYPASAQATTNAGQITLRIDRTIPPAGNRQTRFRYRLTTAMN